MLKKREKGSISWPGLSQQPLAASPGAEINIKRWKGPLSEAATECSQPTNAALFLIRSLDPLPQAQGAGDEPSRVPEPHLHLKNQTSK